MSPRVVRTFCAAPQLGLKPSLYCGGGGRGLAVILVKNPGMSGPAVLIGSYEADLLLGAARDQRWSYPWLYPTAQSTIAPAEARAAFNDVEGCEHEHRSTR
jgi:hypothetical protein